MAIQLPRYYIVTLRYYRAEQYTECPNNNLHDILAEIAKCRLPDLKKEKMIYGPLFAVIIGCNVFPRCIVRPKKGPGALHCGVIEKEAGSAIFQPILIPPRPRYAGHYEHV